MTDLHIHSSFSHDSQTDIEKYILNAIDLGVKYLGISEHVDYDSQLSLRKVSPIDLDAYFDRAKKLQKIYSDKIILLIGLEFGFIENLQTQQRYLAAAQKYLPDFIINSVHLAQGDKPFENGSLYFDYYFDKFGQKKDAYTRYLECVYKSTKCNYHYDIIGHMGYATRYAPYEDKKIDYFEYKEILDAIFKNIINSGKILEVNSSCKLDYTKYLPDYDLLEVYYKLGGRKISYGSDSHSIDRLLEKREVIVADLKKIGFDHITVPFKNKHIEIEI